MPLMTWFMAMISKTQSRLIKKLVFALRQCFDELSTGLRANDFALLSVQRTALRGEPGEVLGTRLRANGNVLNLHCIAVRGDTRAYRGVSNHERQTQDPALIDRQEQLSGTCRFRRGRCTCREQHRPGASRKPAVFLQPACRSQNTGRPACFLQEPAQALPTRGKRQWRRR